MRAKLVTTAIALVLFSQVVLAADNKWQPAVELEGRMNSDRSIFSPKILMPLSQTQDTLLFTDLRMRIDDNDSEEYNVGLGYRRLQNGWILGGYAFIDYLRSANDFNYWQGTAGLEALSDVWDARINAYLPQSTEHTIGGGGALVIDGGGNFGINGGLRERALPLMPRLATGCRSIRWISGFSAACTISMPMVTAASQVLRRGRN